MNIKFRTYDEMVEIEKLLFRQKYLANTSTGTGSYYTGHRHSSIERIRGERDYLFVVIDMENKSYRVTFSGMNNHVSYIYSSMKKTILNTLKIPSYDAKKITYDRS